MSEKQITLMGHWAQRAMWLDIWNNLVMQSRTLDEITVRINDQKVSLPATCRETEIHAVFRTRDIKLSDCDVSRIVIPLTSRKMFTASVRGYHLDHRDSLRIIVLKFPADGVQRAAIGDRPYRGDAKEAQFVEWK